MNAVVTAAPAIPNLAAVTLDAGEIFGGIALENGHWHALIVQPTFAADWHKAMTAAKDGFDLPTCSEARIVRANLNDYLPEGTYWTKEQNELDDVYAYVQDFGRWGGQLYDRKSLEYRAFVLRRVVI